MLDFTLLTEKILKRTDIEKYIYLDRELRKMWNRTVTDVLVFIRALGTASKKF